ncbi:MAG: UDP-N-acetylmuramoyl-L-alanine--D-glutamate ligase, partial [Gammaproteobacteria bacterium]|nr:UDP-N-acetylmuramoyl-L-alanine--D-glutamate ligase [Gammaproteobacteria bacterium]
MNKLFQGKRVAVIGLGISGLATVRFLLKHGVKPVLMDTRLKVAGLEQIPAEKVDGIYLGELDANRLAKMDVLLVSPGLDLSLPAVRFAIAQGVQIIGDVELFAMVNTKPVVAITGSNGKSTVTKLVEHMLNCAGIKALAAGNIGLAVLDALEQIDTEVYVLELSSFQLETTHQLNLVAAAHLNVSEDHLDRHGTMANYAAAKQRIFQHTQLAVWNQDDALTKPQFSVPADIAIGLSSGAYGLINIDNENWLQVANEPLMRVNEMSMVGRHNQFNALAAAAVALAAGASRQGLIKALQTFAPLPHRCTLVADSQGVRWVNDSKATNVNATFFALDFMTVPTIWIVGGVDKGNDYSELMSLVREKVKGIICLGVDNRKIIDAFGGVVDIMVEVNNMQEAVKTASYMAEKGDAVLLSPACASFDLFENYEDRGRQ